jgi:hypothetical protein
MNSSSCKKTLKISFVGLTIVAAIFSFLSSYATEDNKQSQVREIAVHFTDTPITECVKEILSLAGSSANITFKTKKKILVTKELTGRWDTILKAILEGNGLMLTRIDGEYFIIDNPSAETVSYTEKLANSQNTRVSSDVQCTDDNLVTLGYKYSEGANPYALVGKCIKLHDFKPIQYFGATKALATWRYRDGSGTVYVEDLSGAMKLSNARSITAVSVGVYEYGTVIGAKKIIPHLEIH